VLTLLFLLRHGTQALEMHLRFLPASWAPSSFFPRRVFLGGADGPGGVLVVSMGVRRVGWGWVVSISSRRDVCVVVRGAEWARQHDYKSSQDRGEATGGFGSRLLAIHRPWECSGCSQ
jgi:hypothetical protein